MTYWSDEGGKYQKEVKIIQEKYIPKTGTGIRLTASDVANRALIAYAKMAHKYYRFYNDGDRVEGMHSKIVVKQSGGYRKVFPYDDFNENLLENKMDRAILRVWRATKEATLPVVDEIDDYDDYDVYMGKGKVTYEKFRGYRGNRFYKTILDD